MIAEHEARLTQALVSLPRTSLALKPTPLEFLPRFSQAAGGPPIYIKRDDLTGLGFGGNKTRMLELSLAEALKRGADTVVTGAAVQSNYCRQLAAACAKLGLELHLLLRPERAIDQKEIQGNQLLQRIFGAKVTILADNNREAQQAAISTKAESLKAAGKVVYIPRQADTVDLDVISYAESALELSQQCRDLGLSPEKLYVCALDTTQAGLVLGLGYLQSGIKVKGICPLHNMPDRHERMAHLVNQAADRLDLDFSITAAEIDNDDRFIGERYGIPTPDGLAALRLMAQTEGILLDPVYSSKAMAALISHIQAEEISSDTPVIFMHTGGAPAIFGYAQDILAAL